MNLIRSLMTLFLVVLLSLAVAGCIWAGGLPDHSKMIGARVILSACIIAALGSITLLWIEKDTEHA